MSLVGNTPLKKNAMNHHGVKEAFFDTFFQKKATAKLSADAYTHSISENFSRFSFTGKERDEETGYGYFGARYMDHELMTGWLSVDPMSDKYPSISPYAYCNWNPIKFVDPDGTSIDVSKIYERKKDGSYKYEYLVKAFEFFANTEYGRNELAKYAKAGQEIAGHVFKKDGEYHNKNIDISFEAPTVSTHHTGDTKIEKKGKRLNINIVVGNISEVGTVLESLCHETFIHGYQTTKDFIDDGNFTNHSQLSPEMRAWNVSPAQQEHGQDARHNKRMLNEAVPILKKYYSSIGVPRTNAQIIKQINSGMGHYNNIDQ